MTAKTKTTYALNKNALQHYLIEHDLTQDDLAKTRGISTSYCNELLNGRRSISLRNLFSIAEETAIDVRDLVVEVDE